MNRPEWTACLLAISAAACALPPLADPPPSNEQYRALGQEPGWNITIGAGQIRYIGDYGDTLINMPRPDPRPTFNGRRYETARLIVDITYSRCNDAMSGHGYEHQVMVIADGTTVRGCGGLRRTDWDI